jgi:hypothetical protein
MKMGWAVFFATTARNHLFIIIIIII